MDISAQNNQVKPSDITPVRLQTGTRTSRGGLDEINPDDIVYGEYASGAKADGTWIDLVYLDNEILRTFSGPVSSNHPVIEELKIILRSDDMFYLVPVKELESGFAFKRTDIVNITSSSNIQGNARHLPSCVWTMHFADGKARTVEVAYQSYFTYGNTIRPVSMTNVAILDNVFASDNRGNKV